ncbi:hypothetical protein BY996DRAFT_4579107 [Phakopsora pachyrhizi]|nr:hypothetical protein BY996DRAFT_4579107 [Phakopsora pachyrhizi]
MEVQTPAKPEGIDATATKANTPVKDRLRTQWSRLSTSRVGKGVQFGYSWRRPIIFGFGVGVFIGRYYYLKYQAAKRDFVHPDTYLIWRLYDGAIVEYPSNQTNLSMLLGSSGEGSEPPRVMTLYDAIRTIKFIEADDRITGLVADMSSTNAPSVNNDIPLGLAQIEEIQEALGELKTVKERRLGPGKFKTAAFTETFRSQGEYAMASGFDEIYCQPSGELPLVGVNGTVTFYSKLLNWLGINVHAEARTDYKSMVAPYTQEQFTKLQAENHQELLNDINSNMLSMIALNRSRSPKYTELELSALTDRIKSYTKRGPISAKEAIELGLITGTCYKEELIPKLMFGDDPVVLNELDEVLEGREKLQALQETMAKRKKGFYHYSKERRKSNSSLLNVGVVYVLGTIGDVGEFGTGAIVKGLKEAAEDETIGAIILRVDSGGGGVVESDTIWGAVKDLREKGKVVIASFGNIAASGGYLISTHTDGIFASPSTITGSIGVASLRPSFTPSFFERIKITTQSFFTGSKALSLYHELDSDELARHRNHIDAVYQDFKDRVCDGRGISPKLVEQLAGGRVYTGIRIWDMVEEMESQFSDPGDGSGINFDDLWGKSLVNDAVQEDRSENPAIKVSTNEEDKIPDKNIALPQTEPSEESFHEVSSKPTLQPEEVTLNLSSSNGLLGRGIIDGIGGMRDAAIYGVETYLNRIITHTKLTKPEKTNAEIMSEILPGASYQTTDDGALIMEFDIQLKKFPVHKSFWQQLNEASQRGDSIEGSGMSLSNFVKQTFTKWMAKSIMCIIENEIHDLTGIQKSDLKEIKQLGMLRNSGKTGNSSIKAQMMTSNLNF